MELNMKSRYDLMQMSEQKDSVTGYNWPDPLTIPLDQLEFSSPLTRVEINQNYRDRFYNLVYDQWGITYFDDILLYMNGVSIEDTLEIGEELLIPTLGDMNSYYNKNKVTR